MAGSWTNPDGLTIYYGTSERTAAKGGEYEQDGLFRITDHEINLTDITATSILVDRFIFPRKMVVGRVDVIADTAATSGGSAVLNIGFVKASDGTTAIDTDGLVAAIPLASLNAEGKTTSMTQGSTSAGALVGQVVSNSFTSQLVADYDTAAFTAGRLRVRIYWYRKTATT